MGPTLRRSRRAAAVLPAAATVTSVAAFRVPMTTIRGPGSSPARRCPGATHRGTGRRPRRGPPVRVRRGGLATAATMAPAFVRAGEPRVRVWRAAPPIDWRPANGSCQAMTMAAPVARSRAAGRPREGRSGGRPAADRPGRRPSAGPRDRPPARGAPTAGAMRTPRRRPRIPTWPGSSAAPGPRPRPAAWRRPVARGRHPGAGWRHAPVRRCPAWMTNLSGTRRVSGAWPGQVGGRR